MFYVYCILKYHFMKMNNLIFYVKGQMENAHIKVKDIRYLIKEEKSIL